MDTMETQKRKAWAKQKEIKRLAAVKNRCIFPIMCCTENKQEEEIAQMLFHRVELYRVYEMPRPACTRSLIWRLLVQIFLELT